MAVGAGCHGPKASSPAVAVEAPAAAEPFLSHQVLAPSSVAVAVYVLALSVAIAPPVRQRSAINRVSPNLTCSVLVSSLNLDAISACQFCWSVRKE